MNVFVVIVTYNPLKWITPCFESLKHSTIPLQTIVVDNGSTDGSQKKIQSAYPEVDFIASEINLGFGAANNIGIKKAYDQQADFIFLLNQDAWIEPNTIEKLISVSQKNPEFGILSPMHFNGIGDGLDYNFSTFISPEKCKGLLSDIIVDAPLKDVYETPFVNAAAWLLTKECIETVGGFNPSFFHYAEDINYADRVMYHKLKIGIVPEVKIFHDRAKRDKSYFIKDKRVILIRKMTTELSKPKTSKSKKHYYLIEIKNIFTGFGNLNFKKIIQALKNFQSLLKVNSKVIDNNRKKSTKKGTTFL